MSRLKHFIKHLVSILSIMGLIIHFGPILGLTMGQAMYISILDVSLDILCKVGGSRWEPFSTVGLKQL